MEDIPSVEKHGDDLSHGKSQADGYGLSKTGSVAVGDIHVVTGHKQTKRSLHPRHIQMMAFSGAIGTGLFVGSGSALARAGPLGLLLGYAVYSLLVWSTFNAMGEMAVWLPIDGSFVVFAHTYLDPAWGFALGWLYTVTNMMSTTGEVAAAATIIQFWTTDINSGMHGSKRVCFSCCPMHY